ncbi:MAG: helix-turn-helix transcriptional regulator, partial [Acidobacteria bacterium]|nr:helix-turn-helix transcriptional regulator [Acidobacteriota bacterium]
KLSERELQVLRLYASGMTLKQVAYELQISKHTAKEHIDRVRGKYSEVGRPAMDKSELLIRLIEDGLYGEDLI